MLKKLKRLDYLIEQINDEELKLLIIDSLMEIVKELPEEIKTSIERELKVDIIKSWENHHNEYRFNK